MNNDMETAKIFAFPPSAMMGRVKRLVDTYEVMDRGDPRFSKYWDQIRASFEDLMARSVGEEAAQEWAGQFHEECMDYLCRPVTMLYDLDGDEFWVEGDVCLVPRSPEYDSSA